MKHLCCLALLTLICGCSRYTSQHLYDEDFIMLSDQISPNKKYRLLEYHFDHGALGYSQIFWAIIPANIDTVKIDLTDYILPDGYKAKRWQLTGEAIIEKWEPYYYKHRDVVLNTGDTFLGVKWCSEIGTFSLPENNQSDIYNFQS